MDSIASGVKTFVSRSMVETHVVLHGCSHLYPGDRHRTINMSDCEPSSIRHPASSIQPYAENINASACTAAVERG